MLMLLRLHPLLTSSMLSRPSLMHKNRRIKVRTKTRNLPNLKLQRLRRRRQSGRRRCSSCALKLCLLKQQ